MELNHNSNEIMSELDELDSAIVSLESALKRLRDRRDKVYLFLDKSTAPRWTSLKELLELKRSWARNKISSRG